MIEKLVENFDVVEREVGILTRALVFLLVLLLFRIGYFVLKLDFASAWGLVGPLSAIAGALLVSKIATRLIIHGQVLREDDRRKEIVRITHYLIVMTQDLRGRVSYLKTIMIEGDKPLPVLLSLIESIEHRFGSLFEKDLYQHLPGRSADLISDMSGSIYGITATAETLRSGSVNPLTPIRSLLGEVSAEYISNMDRLLKQIQTLTNQIYEVRMKISPSNKEEEREKSN